jgi:two-component system chemotaxis response regulator CheB
VSRVRVLVVDDSAFARKVVREVLASDPALEVVDIARDGLEALEKIAELRPDVVTLDLVMPNLDGLGLLRALPPEGAPRVVVVTTSDAESRLGLAALEAGAVDLVHKPTALATSRLYDLGEELRRKVRQAAVAVPRRAAAAERAEALPRSGPTRVVVVGASTGGPPAVTRLLAALPADFPCGLAIAVHLPPEYTQAFARRLHDVSPLRVMEAEEGAVLAPGTAMVARGGLHLKLRAHAGEIVARIDADPLLAAHKPSVDVLFTTAAAAAGSGVLAVVLTGMGDDGLLGARAVKAAGGRVLAESEESCVVYGMPRVVTEAGLVEGVAPIQRMAAAILARL